MADKRPFHDCWADALPEKFNRSRARSRIECGNGGDRFRFTVTHGGVLLAEIRVPTALFGQLLAGSGSPPEDGGLSFADNPNEILKRRWQDNFGVSIPLSKIDDLDEHWETVEIDGRVGRVYKPMPGVKVGMMLALAEVFPNGADSGTHELPKWRLDGHADVSHGNLRMTFRRRWTFDPPEDPKASISRWGEDE